MAQQPIPPPPNATPVLEKNLFSSPWIIWLTSIWTAIRSIANVVAPPPTSGTAGIAGQIAFDANFAYFCVQTNTPVQPAIWKRVPLNAF